MPRATAYEILQSALKEVNAYKRQVQNLIRHILPTGRLDHYGERAHLRKAARLATTEEQAVRLDIETRTLDLGHARDAIERLTRELAAAEAYLAQRATHA